MRRHELRNLIALLLLVALALTFWFDPAPGPARDAFHATAAVSGGLGFFLGFLVAMEIYA